MSYQTPIRSLSSNKTVPFYVKEIVTPHTAALAPLPFSQSPVPVPVLRLSCSLDRQQF